MIPTIVKKLSIMSIFHSILDNIEYRIELKKFVSYIFNKRKWEIVNLSSINYSTNSFVITYLIDNAENIFSTKIINAALELNCYYNYSDIVLTINFINWETGKIIQRKRSYHFK